MSTPLMESVKAIDGLSQMIMRSVEAGKLAPAKVQLKAVLREAQCALDHIEEGVGNVTKIRTDPSFSDGILDEGVYYPCIYKDGQGDQPCRRWGNLPVVRREEPRQGLQSGDHRHCWDRGERHPRAS